MERVCHRCDWLLPACPRGGTHERHNGALRQLHGRPVNEQLVHKRAVSGRVLQRHDGGRTLFNHHNRAVPPGHTRVVNYDIHIAAADSARHADAQRHTRSRRGVARDERRCNGVASATPTATGATGARGRGTASRWASRCRRGTAIIGIQGHWDGTGLPRHC